MRGGVRSGAEGRIPERHVCALSQAAGGSRLPGGGGEGDRAEAGGPVTYQLRPSVAQGQSREAALECVSFPLKVKRRDAHTHARVHAETKRAAVGSCCFHAHARMNIHAIRTHSCDLFALDPTTKLNAHTDETFPCSYPHILQSFIFTSIELQQYAVWMISRSKSARLTLPGLGNVRALGRVYRLHFMCVSSRGRR